MPEEKRNDKNIFKIFWPGGLSYEQNNKTKPSPTAKG